MAYDDYDYTAPYRGAVDATSRYLIPAMENTPAGMASRAVRGGAEKLWNNYLRAPMQRGGQAMSQALQGVPPVGPLGVMKDTAGLMAGMTDPAAAGAAAPAAPPAPAAPAAPAAPPMAMGSPAPAPMPAPSPAAPRAPSPAGSLAAPPAPSATPGAAPVAAGAPTTPAGVSGAISPEQAALNQRQKALDEYYTGVIGTGSDQRKAERMHGLSQSLRSGMGRGTWQTELADAISGGTKAYSLYKGLQGDEERAKKLADLRSQYLRATGGGGGEGPVGP